MAFLHAGILAIIEGITEFLPISSTGHLILASHAFGIADTDFTKSFEIIIQLGAILAIVVLYWRTFLFNRNYWPKIIAGFVPTAIVGFTFYPLIKHVLLSSPLITLWSLLIGGIALILIEKFHKEKESHKEDLSQLSYTQAVLIGCFQAVSVIPGVSRAGATIVGGLIVGTKRKTAVEFSFLLAVPTMLAATGLDVVKSHTSFTPDQVVILSVGFVIAFLTALVVVKYFLLYIQNHSFVSFGVYRIMLALVYWLVLLR